MSGLSGSPTAVYDRLAAISLSRYHLPLIFPTNLIYSQKYSRYLPVVNKSKSHRKSSISMDWETKRETERALRAAETTKRRSTMNSRAAYDDDEVLRKVLEESKVDGVENPSETETSRKGKRAREESEEYVTMVFGAKTTFANTH
jgi:hypothetical protein